MTIQLASCFNRSRVVVAHPTAADADESAGATDCTVDRTSFSPIRPAHSKFRPARPPSSEWLADGAHALLEVLRELGQGRRAL